MAEGDGRTTCSGGSEEEEEEESDMEEEEAAGKDGEGRVYLPGLPLAEGEELVREESAYRLFQRAQTGAPCLSFDIVRDNLGEGRTEFPLTLTLCAGTQADTAQANRLLVMKMHNLWGNKPRKETSDGETDSESESESSGDEEEGGEGDRKPRLEIAMVPHHGGINRVRVSELRAGYPVAAVWGDTGRVEVWELQQPLRAVADAQGMRHFLQEQQDRLRPLHSFAGHMGEGFALDWSPTAPGRLATGDCKRNIHVWEPVEGGTWNVDQRPYTAHSRSVEDIQWSPNEPTVFASCSADASIRVWDTRVGPARGCMLTEAGAHGSDVNVISWNRHEPFICSGGDDGLIRIWDLRHFGNGVAVASFKLHSAPVSTVEWSAAESSVVAAAGADDVLSQWDLSVERDGPGGGGDGESGLSHLPPQLLFIHQGQRDIKELHWHPQCPGLILSTALSGFDVFRTLSV